MIGIDQQTLPYRIDCQWPNKPYWETLAAMNAENPAIDYAKAAADANKCIGIKYRVVHVVKYRADVAIWNS